MATHIHRPRTEDEVYQRGVGARREVFGDAYVDQMRGAEDDLTADFQYWINSYVFGSVWTHPALDRRTRRLITIAMLVALDRPDEITRHTRTALRDDVPPEELREVLLQAAVYCGLPKAVSAFAAAQLAFQQVAENADAV